MQKARVALNDEERVLLKALGEKSTQETVQFLQAAYAQEAEPSSRAVLAALLIKVENQSPGTS